LTVLEVFIMGSRLLDKKEASLLWTLLECVFFSGVVLGWPWLAVIFRTDYFLLSGCNVTIPPPTAPPPDTDYLPPPPEYVVRQVVRKIPCKKSVSDVRGDVDLNDDVIANLTMLGTSGSSSLSTHSPPSDDDLGSEDTVSLDVGEDEVEEEELCPDQRETLRLLFALVIVMKDLLALPFGAFFDKYGTTRTRLLTV
jgi:hypothetical protein